MPYTGQAVTGHGAVDGPAGVAINQTARLIPYTETAYDTFQPQAETMPGRQTGKARDSEFRNWRFEAAPGSYCPLAKRLRHGTLTAASAGSNPARAAQKMRSVRLSWKGRETPDLLMWVRVPRGVFPVCMTDKNVGMARGRCGLQNRTGRIVTAC